MTIRRIIEELLENNNQLDTKVYQMDDLELIAPELYELLNA